MRWLWTLISWILVWGILTLPEPGRAADFVVYSVHRALDMGNPGEKKPPKEYLVNMGPSEGARTGTILQVFRRTPTYDLLAGKLYRDISFPIARLKVIHSESGSAVARLESMLPIDQTPFFAPADVMIGDIVRLAR